MIEVVVARYKEQLSWLSTLDEGIRTRVYNKGPDDIQYAFEKLPNVGHESNTYLHHICKRYHELAPVTVFVQGSIIEHIIDGSDEKSYIQNLVTEALHSDSGMSQNFVCEPNVPWAPRPAFKISQWNGVKNVDTGQVLGAWFENFILEQFPDHMTFLWYPGALFAASREAIHRRPKAYYKRLLTTVSQCIAHEASHFIERSWFYIFNPQIKNTDVITLKMFPNAVALKDTDYVITLVKNAGSGFTFFPSRRTILLSQCENVHETITLALRAIFTITEPTLGVVVAYNDNVNVNVSHDAEYVSLLHEDGSFFIKTSVVKTHLNELDCVLKGTPTVKKEDKLIRHTNRNAIL